MFALGSTQLVRLAESDGAGLQSIDFQELVGEPGVRPWSAISIAEGASAQPVLIVSGRAPSSAYVIAVDVLAQMALWSTSFPDNYGDLPRGQWPILARTNGERVVVFTTRNGVRALGGPSK